MPDPKRGAGDDMDTTAITPQFNAEEYVDRLRRQNTELADSLRHLAAFQEKLRALRVSDTTDAALDAMELLLEEVVDFTYLRLYVYDDEEEGEMRLLREMCPQDYPVNWDLIHWTVTNHELAFIPFDPEEGTTSAVKNLLILPLSGHSKEMGVLLLWVDFDMNDFTQERSTLLNMLARETASILEALRLRRSVEDARAEIADIVENIPMGILALDARERPILINGTAEYIFGFRRDEAAGKPLVQLLPPYVVSQLRPALTGEAADDAELEGGELEINFGHVEESFGVTVAPLRASAAEGEEEEGVPPPVRGHILVCRDLKLSREVAKLRELDAMKNDFLSLVSHELRTPLTSIMAYSETLLMEGMIDSEEERREYLEIIHSEGERLSRLINDVLDLTKMESGKMDYTYGVIEIPEVIRTATAAVHSLADQKKMPMSQEIEEGLPALKADRDKLIQVMTNLYSNAIKFTDEGGSILTRARRVAQDEETGSAMVEVSVTDTGMGIPEGEIHKVFSKFEQVEKIDHHSVGTGLGMPICKLIIEEGHAGRIWLESTVGVGTTFFFRIPVA